MRFELLDFQRTAAENVLRHLSTAETLRTASGSPSAFALSAITGSGKTVIATAVIEGLLLGSPDLDVDPDPDVAFLWITDDPALNRQTISKMLAASELLGPGHLMEITDGYLEPDLPPGKVYFLNTQKLSKTARLAQSGTNLRQMSFWDVLTNTITGGRTRLVMILDEAHRGMRAGDRATIVQRLIHGQAGSNPPMPVVWGISATIERFTTAMGESHTRAALPPVQVPIEKVQASGLIKDGIGLDQPAESGSYSTTLLRDAVHTTLDYEARWRTYSETEDEPLVLPAMVIQVPDLATDAHLTELVSTIESEWPNLGPKAIAHVFGDHQPIVLGSRTIPWVAPETIQTTPEIRVVLAKEAISTGWDCPRAEVMYSERPASDATHIAQVIGRMVRQPLAMRIPTDDVLNTVACYLPLFDRDTVDAIKTELEGGGPGNGQNQVGPQVLRDPKVFNRNQHLEPEVFEFVESLPSESIPDRSANPLRRAKRLAQLLSGDHTGTALLADADAELNERLHRRLDGLLAEHRALVDERINDLLHTDVRRTEVSTLGADQRVATRRIATHRRDANRDASRIIRRVREGVGLDYLTRRVKDPQRTRDAFDLKIEVAALLGIPEVLNRLEDAADEWVQEHLGRFAVEIGNTTGATRDRYRRIQDHTTRPESVSIDLRDNDKAATCDAKGSPLPTYPGHLYADLQGQYPIEFQSSWERTVIDTETARPSFVAWYRNPSRPTPNSLRIAYEHDNAWRSLQVDFIVISRRGDDSLAASIVDPHSDHHADARAKLLALARFAHDHPDAFVRIESITEISGELRSLDLTDSATREAIEAHTADEIKTLYAGPHSRRYQ